MSTSPVNLPVDQAVADWITDLQPARTWVLNEIHARQHSMMSAWGGPGHWCSLHIDEGDTATVLVRVPPGVTEMDMTLLCSGIGDVTITSTNDATGSRLVWLMQGDLVTAAWPVSTTGESDSGNGANTGRAVTVSSSVTWAWATERLTFTVASGGPGTIWGVLLKPIHRAR